MGPGSLSSMASSSSAMAPMPVDLSVDPMNVAPELKAEGPDWFAVFNALPSAPGDGGVRKRALDVQPLHSLHHERCVVLCLRLDRC